MVKPKMFKKLDYLHVKLDKAQKEAIRQYIAEKGYETFASGVRQELMKLVRGAE